MIYLDLLSIADKSLHNIFAKHASHPYDYISMYKLLSELNH